MTTQETQLGFVGNGTLFDIAPTPIWLQDWSNVAAFCKRQRADGVTGLRAVLAEDRALLCDVISMIDIRDVNQAAADFVGADTPAALRGPIPATFLNDDTLPTLVELIVAVWNGDTFFAGEISGLGMGGQDLVCHLEWAAPTADGEPDYSQVVTMLHDLSQQRAAERAMTDHVSQLESLLEVGRKIAATLDIDAILQMLVDTTISLVGADRCLILLFDIDAGCITQRFARGNFDEDIVLRGFDQVMQGFIGHAIKSGQAARSDDIATDSRTTNRARQLPGTSAVVAPIIVDETVLGALLALNNAEDVPFTDLDQSLVSVLAAQAAVAIRNASLYDELRRSHESLQAAHEDLKRTQTQLLAAQKMEAIGSLAAGIAHEINTPIQFVSDNTTFVNDAVAALRKVVDMNRDFIAKVGRDGRYLDDIKAISKMWEEKDLDFLVDEVPAAVAETLEGANRVAEIVRAMKEFAHPGSDSKTSVDINHVIRTTVKVSRNEWKYVADVELDLDESLPIIDGLPGPLGQTVLILLVNSAQAIAGSRDVGIHDKGRIVVSTRCEDECIELCVADNGPGIPADISNRIFDPFFTTKEVGKGSGQGLSIARSVIVEKHQGQIWVEDGDPGAVFVIRLPVRDRSNGPGVESDDE